MTDIADHFQNELEAAEAADRQRRRVVRRSAVLRELSRRPTTSGDNAPARVVCLVGCGKAKAARPMPARELYTSPLFRKSLELAELLGDATYVVSASSENVLELDRPLDPYDAKIALMPRAMRMRWGVEIVKSVVLRTLSSTPRLRVVLFMGAGYAEPIVRAIDEARETAADRWAPPIDLLRGLEIGDRLAFLNRAILLARGAK